MYANKEFQREWFKKYRKDHAEYFNQKHKEWRQRNRAHFRCNYTFLKYKKKNNIKPLPCSMCLNSKTEAHHNDYCKPLVVVWLCKDCHEWLHSNNMSLRSMETNYA